MEKKSFSQRMGIKPVKSAFQINNIDPSLRISLWNELTEVYWSMFKTTTSSTVSSLLREHASINDLFLKLWQYYFNLPVDEIDKYWSTSLEIIKNYFFSCPWNEVYEFIEFVANNYRTAWANERFMINCNIILERELSAYRFVGGVIVPMPSKQEVVEVEEALDVSQKFSQHLGRALELLADKKVPDYRNSIKESISAVEAICQLVAGSPKVTLGVALRELESKLGTMHPALKEAFNRLYGYTSDAQGVRHAFLGQSDLDIEDAKFMLIACSAFINYLVAKAEKAGIKLSEK